MGALVFRQVTPARLSMFDTPVEVEDIPVKYVY